MDRIDLARNLAERLHKGQPRHFGGGTTFDHCRRVATRLATAKTDRDGLMVVAYLHDVLEDTGFDRLCIRLLFGPEILEDVETLTREVDGDEPYTAYIDRVLKGSDRAILVKLADLADNLTPPAESGGRWESLRARYIKAHVRLVRELVARNLALRPDLELLR